MKFATGFIAGTMTGVWCAIAYGYPVYHAALSAAHTTAHAGSALEHSLPLLVPVVAAFAVIKKLLLLH